MSRFATLLTLLAACSSNAPSDEAVFHGSVGQSVTHVMAVSPSAGDLQKVVAATENGEFSIAVEPGRPWVLVFVDASKRGADMVRGVLRSDSLDTFLPLDGGDIDLGKISIDGRDATMAGSSEDLDSALGLSRRTLATLGGLDDIALRYANPDIDGDGVIDALQNRAARLELTVEYAMTVGERPANAEDLVTKSDAIGYDHLGTGIYARLPDGIALDKASASVTFEQPYWGFDAGPYTAAVPAGQPVTGLTFGGDGRFGVYARPDHPVPSGAYKFSAGGHELSFTFVRPPAEMVRNQVMPRVQLVPTHADCLRDCEIDSIAWSWARRTDAGWITLTDEEAFALHPTGAIDVISTYGNRHYEIPADATGSMPWQQELYRQGKVTSGDLEYVQIGFQLRPGMKMIAVLGDTGKAAPSLTDRLADDLR